MSSTDNPSRNRRKLLFLLNGRRVRISDLLEAKLLTQGQTLYFQQYRGQEPHKAVVTDRAQLRLVDGREFDSPSAAAAAAGELRAAPGWSIWRVGSNGPTLHQLRRRLLDSVAKEAANEKDTIPDLDIEGIAAAVEREIFLHGASDSAKIGVPKELSVRELLRIWGLDERDRAGNAEIDADLANHDLTTVPDFRAVNLDRVIQIVPLTEAKSETASTSAVRDEPEELGAEVDQEAGDIGLTLGQLLRPDHVLQWVPPSATFEEAITIMHMNDYSQLAVLADPRTLHGAISWKSIAEAKNADTGAIFSDAIDRAAKVFSYDTRLLDVLATLQREEFIFVRDHTRTIVGIITATDVVATYDATATPFFLIGEIDQELRQLIQSLFDEEAVREACRGARLSFQGFDSMTFAQYRAVFDDLDCWKRLGWKLHRESVVTHLDEVRKIRNRVMHFNADTIEPVEVKKLNNFLKTVRTYGRRSSVSTESTPLF
ncbi:hypothetical protein Vqi01_25850 [Micromonospora qiuiae]|uniref:CBS domain-containing protein n=1 Tax=Micromonospora qiuiae TaxID=502268 RepID=A0ABQ4JBF8_9ACTN|nr:CBS domain-containing protein [Micromonospora qiuiae]GIJ27423.1 hypothetical protein Vqi01_25850 [Micromonospora qiuiae]